jgi:hypothetical protein
VADAEFEAKRLAELLERANAQLAQFGEVTKQTQQELVDAQMKAKYGINNYTAVTAKAGEALGAVASAGINAGKSMLEGKKGAAALNSSLDDLAKAATIAGTALTLLMPGGLLIKGVVAAFTAVTAATIGSVKAANEMADKLYKGYSGLAKSGGAAADGMTGVFNNAKKLGLSMNELDGFVSLINENSSDLALFSGSVAKGRERLADMGDALRGSREGFLAMGLSMQDVSEGMAGYMRLQARTGNMQERSARDSAAAAKEYIYQQDALAKITGINVKDQQKIREAALTEEMFLAKIRQLQREGRTKEAEELQVANIMMSKHGEETGRAFRASITGRLTDEAARKGMMATNGEMQRSTAMLAAGQIDAAQFTNRVNGAMKENLARQGDQMALLGINNGVQLKYNEMVNAATQSQVDQTKALEEARRQTQAQAAGADAMTGKQADIMNRQINTNEKMETALKDLIPAAQDVMLTMQHGADKLADAFKRIVEAINELLDIFGFGKSKEAKAKEQKTDEARGKFDQTMQGASLTQKIGIGRTEAQQQAYEEYRRREAEYNLQRAQDRRARREKRGDTGTEVGMADIPMAAKGGLLTGPDSGYLAMLHGTEMVIPVDGLGKKLEDLKSGVNYAEVLRNATNNTLIKNLEAMQGGNLSTIDLLKKRIEMSQSEPGVTYHNAVRGINTGGEMMKLTKDLQKGNISANTAKMNTSGEMMKFFDDAVVGIVQDLKPKKVTSESAEKISGYINDISSDLMLQVKTIDKDTKGIKKFSDFQEGYQRKMTKYMQEVLDLCEDNSPDAVIGMQQAGGAAGGGGILGKMMNAFSTAFGGGASAAGAAGAGAQQSSAYSVTPPSTGGGTGLTAGGSAAAPGMGGGTGLKAPEPHEAVGPGGSGGQGIKTKPALTSVRSKTGKSAQVNAEFAPRFQGIIDYLDSVGYKIYSLGGFVDRDVRGKPGVKSVHAHGGAIDINPAENPLGPNLVTDMPENVSAIAKKLGLGWGGNWTSVKDAMHFSVAKHEGGEIKLSEGGVAVGPNSGYPATLHGEEAVIPLNNNGGNFVKLFESMADSNAKMAAMMEEMVRAQKSGNDISNKMLRMQS